MRWDQYRTIEFEDLPGGIRICRLNRPERLNAVNPWMHRELSWLARDLQEDDAVKVAILTGAGRAFCAGGDQKQTAEDVPPGRAPASEIRWREAEEIVRGLMDLEKPIISMVNGPAMGLGATIALLCDVVIMAKSARIADSHVNVGLVAGDGGATIWPLLCGLNKAKEYLMLGTHIYGERAVEVGLASYCYDDDQLYEKTLEHARQFLRMPTYAMRATKATVQRHLRQSIELTLEAGLTYEAISVRDPDRVEGGAAFRERREPSFTSRMGTWGDR
ncbi:MAG: enoyl-CoA hydratase/isomerase family protein [Dehalococcoidia bacterium]|nr:enoyl-CoA hydratase/isomerase family protein [Dehalococcoidia bacterium]